MNNLDLPAVAEDARHRRPREPEKVQIFRVVEGSESDADDGNGSGGTEIIPVLIGKIGRVRNMGKTQH